MPNLFVADELSVIRDNLRKAAKKLGIPEMADTINEFFFDRVKQNMHIVLCFSPIGIDFRNYCKMYPSIVNSTTIDWFLPWPDAALWEVA